MLALTLIFIISQAITGPSALAQDYDLKSTPKVRVDAAAEEDEDDGNPEGPGRAPPVRKLGVPPRKLPIAKAIKANEIVRWGGSVSYGVRTDLADQVKPRLYSHTLGLSYGMQHVPSGVSLIGILAAAYESTGERNSEVLVDEDRAELFVNDFTLAMQVDWNPQFWKSSISTTLANEFPTSPEAQRESYGSVTSFELDWSVPLYRKAVSASLTGEVYYIWNTYEYSPATGDLNKQGGTRGAMSLRWKIWQGWFVSGVVGSQTSRYLDGTTDVTYRNAFSTGYAWSAFTVSVSTSNGTYLDREEANVWFVDEYRRTLSMGARLSF